MYNEKMIMEEVREEHQLLQPFILQTKKISAF